MDSISGSAIQPQVDFASSLFHPKLTSDPSTLDIHKTAIHQNGEDGGYGPIEADFLYAFILKHRPAKIVKVGGGVSTSIILRAANDTDYLPELYCVEPYPTRFLTEPAIDGRIRLFKQPAQEVDMSLFRQLNDGDLLFVDSTRVVKPGSEVNRVILDVLPSLRPGVFVHFHDVYFPYDYTRNILTSDLFFWSESAFLHAFLSENTRWNIRVSLSMLHYRAPESLKALMPSYMPQDNDHGLIAGPSAGRHFPSSIFLQTRRSCSNQSRTAES